MRNASMWTRWRGVSSFRGLSSRPRTRSPAGTRSIGGMAEMTSTIGKMAIRRGLRAFLSRFLADGTTFQYRLGVYMAANKLLSLRRRAMNAIKTLDFARNADIDEYQRPWLPRWEGLTARPFHDPTSYDWVKRL